MTVHRLDEAIVFVSWVLPMMTSQSFGSLHIQRPRSMKGLGYCGIRILSKKDVQRLNVVTVDDPWNIPLEIRAERDLVNICPRCARAFVDETVDEHEAVPYVKVPDLWKHIHSTALRSRRAEVDAAEIDG